MMSHNDHDKEKKCGDTRWAADYLNLSYSKLTKDRVHGRGPAFIRLGKRIVYRKEDLDLFLEQNVHSSTSEYS